MLLKTTSLSIVLTFTVLAVTAQNFVDAYKHSVRAYNRHAYDDAIGFLREALSYDPNHEHCLYLMAMANKNLQQYDMASMAFNKLVKINPDYNPWFYMEAGEMYIDINNFQSAEYAFKQFIERYPDIPTNMMNIHRARNRMNYIKKSPGIRSKDNTTGEPVLVTTINSEADDFTPQINAAGNILYFTSERQGGFDVVKDSASLNNFGQDIYYSVLYEDGWSVPKVMPEPINSMKDDFGATFSGDGQTMVYVRCGEEEGVGNCDLYISHLVGRSWGEPVNMGNVVNSEGWDSQPTISSDGTRIIFASTREGGYGSIDLYITEKTQFGWGIPQNLGSRVNSPYRDSSPYLASDGKTLYFASDGHPGLGGQDVFYSLFDNGRWTTPLNVGAPINSDGDDKNFTTSAGGMAFFASSRLDEENYDLFQVELPDFLKPKPSLVVQGIVTNANSGDFIEAVVMVEDFDNGEVLAINKSNSTTGEYVVVLPVGRNYSVSASKDGYFFYSQSFELPKDTSYLEMTKDILLEPITKGTKVVLNNIFFESGRAELKPISYIELNKAVDLLQQNASMIIEIGGHTDNVGSEELNLKLSQSRAEAVKSYLELAGIESSRLQAKGYGESMPLETNDTAEGRKANRRTEFVIVEF